MLRDFLNSLLGQAFQALGERGFAIEALAAPEVSEPKDPSHGDFACNFALVSAKAMGKNPREVAEALKEEIEKLNNPAIESVEIAGPGFLNLRLSSAWVGKFVASILERGDKLAKSVKQNPRAINIEFVSVNPNGPITVGSGRGAAFGSALCNVLEAAGDKVWREYYVNDGVNSEQMLQFALSVRALAKGEPLPEKAYRGDYVSDVAEKVKPLAEEAGWPEDPVWWQRKSEQLMIAKQKEDLEAFGVVFDRWFHEQKLHDEGLVERDIQELVEVGAADYEPERTVIKLAKGGKIDEVTKEVQPHDEDDVEGTQKTLWLRSTKFGDDMDRVLRRKYGRLTYIASDVSYHRVKLEDLQVDFEGQERGLITILGPDHHGYIQRLRAVLAASFMNRMGESEPIPVAEEEKLIYGDAEEKGRCLSALEFAKKHLDVVIFQIVRFVKNGQPAPMRKRDGNIYALIDLVMEVGKTLAPEAPVEEQIRLGKDVGRFFYLMRSHDTHLDFDIELATSKSDENPVFYVQYAHARICSILHKAQGVNLNPSESNLELLTHEREKTLIKAIADLPYEVRRAAADYGVNRLATYAIELARTFHHFYDACRVVDEGNKELSEARLALCVAARNAMRCTFELLGISAPESM